MKRDVDTKVSDLCYAVKFENHVKNKNNFFAEADTKKHRYASAKASAFADCRGEFRMLHQIYSTSIPYNLAIFNTLLRI